jgi:hypothetical protein
VLDVSKIESNLSQSNLVQLLCRTVAVVVLYYWIVLAVEWLNRMQRVGTCKCKGVCAWAEGEAGAAGQQSA